jgi:hypothetical protein
MSLTNAGSGYGISSEVRAGMSHSRTVLSVTVLAVRVELPSSAGTEMFICHFQMGPGTHATS